MLTYCQDEATYCTDYQPASQPRLLFVCKTSGEESAIPRVMHKHHDRLELMFIARGSGDYEIGGINYSAQQGDLLVFNAGVVHDERPHLSSDSLIYSCGIEGLSLTGLMINHLISSDKSPVVASLEQDKTLLALFETLWVQSYQKAPHYGPITHSLLNALVMICRNIWQEKHAELSKSELTLGMRIKSYIDENYHEQINLDIIAQELKVNLFYMIHVFKSYSGYSPKQYLIRRRVGEAQTLLLSTEHAVATIASMVGYENVNNFHRVFKMVVGLPPSQYKNLWRDGIQS